MNHNTSSFSCKPPTVTFHGAARSVSGSIHLLEAGPYRFLLDCGLYRGTREEARMRNAYFDFDPSTIDAVFLSHAHVDHCGNIPNLIRQGFTGPIYCTHATRDLISVMLTDSTRIHEKKNEFVGTAIAHSTLASSHTTKSIVDRTIDSCIGLDYMQTICVNSDVQIHFVDSGHILGSAMIAVRLMHGGREYTITFTGDIGRRGVPFVSEPSPVPPADLIICESTYGGKTHDSLEAMSTKMSDLVKQTLKRGGKVLIPAFSLGRTQLVLHYLQLWMTNGLLPRLPIYVDSPLAQKIDVVYHKYRKFLTPAENDIPCEWLESDDDVWFRSTQRESCIIIASGGMCEGGRIVQHLKYHIDDPRSTIILVCYQAPGSLGSQLLSPVATVRFNGHTWNKWIEVAEVKGFSGHADQDDFDWLLRGAVKETGKVRLVHGDPQQMLALGNQLREMGFPDVGAPKRGEVVTL